MHTHTKPFGHFSIMSIERNPFSEWGRLLLAGIKPLLSSIGWIFHTHTHTSTQTLRNVQSEGRIGRELPPWMIGPAAKGHSLLEETISSVASIERAIFLSFLVRPAGWRLLCFLLCSALENNSSIFVDKVSQMGNLKESSVLFFC